MRFKWDHSGLESNYWLFFGWTSVKQCWVRQCHQPPMTGHGKYSTYKIGRGMVYDILWLVHLYSDSWKLQQPHCDVTEMMVRHRVATSGFISVLWLSTFIQRGLTPNLLRGCKRDKTRCMCVRVCLCLHIWNSLYIFILYTYVILYIYYIIRLYSIYFEENFWKCHRFESIIFLVSSSIVPDIHLERFFFPKFPTLTLRTLCLRNFAHS